MSIEINEKALEALPASQVAPVIEELRPVLQHALALQVTDEASYMVAMEGVRKCKAAVRRIEELFSESRESAHRAHRAICAAINSLEKPAEQAAEVYHGKAYSWEQQERQRRAAEERKRQAEELKKQEDARLEVAQVLSDNGMKGAAERILERTIEVPAQEVREPIKPEGVSSRENWQFEITDEDAIPREYLTPDLKKIGQVVKAMKGKTAIPGVRPFNKGTTSVRQGAA